MKREEEEAHNVQPEVVEASVVFDSGATDHTTPPDTVPEGAEFTINRSGKHFVGAGGDVITKHGAAKMKMAGSKCTADIKFQVADVTKTLQSVSKTCGPEEGPGKYDVIFTNKVGVVMPAGILDKVLATGVKPLAEYHRKGGLYVANVKLSGPDVKPSGFQRQE